MRQRLEALAPVNRVPETAVLSQLPVKNVLPFGLNATDVTSAECSTTGPTGSPVVASQSRAFLSMLPVKMVFPSGLKVTEYAVSICSRG